ncbi:MAG: DUF3455 domain-containing protein [Methylococcaceae bacterium]|nr:DUF3455 domain-containing protein [Methylococcaceae bacterium]
MFNKSILFSAILNSVFLVSTPCFAESAEFAIYNQAPSIPPQIRAPSEYSPAVSIHAIGDQIYQCTVTKETYSWVLQGPDAKLLDMNGHQVGKHYLGPTWEFNGNNRLGGKIIKRLNVDGNKAIAWLLIKVVTSHGNGLYSGVNFINRINTKGGLAPSIVCDANHLGSEKRVAYTADYIFYK